MSLSIQEGVLVRWVGTAVVWDVVFGLGVSDWVVILVWTTDRRDPSLERRSVEDSAAKMR